jgi:hypothetical protein
LRVKDLIAYVKSKPQILEYFPIENEMTRLPRWYIIDLIYSVDGDSFKKWADSRRKERDSKMKSKLKVNIKMSEYAKERFAASTHCTSRSFKFKAIVFVENIFKFYPLIFCFSNCWKRIFNAEGVISEKKK